MSAHLTSCIGLATVPGWQRNRVKEEILDFTNIQLRWILPVSWQKGLTSLLTLRCRMDEFPSDDTDDEYFWRESCWSEADEDTPVESLQAGTTNEPGAGHRTQDTLTGITMASLNRSPPSTRISAAARDSQTWQIHPWPPGVQLTPHLAVFRGNRTGEETVESRLNDIVGSPIRQHELIALRKGLFEHLLPKLSRSECRKKADNLTIFEKHREIVLAILESAPGVQEVMDVASRHRASERDWRQLLFHLKTIHAIQ
jgi:hypothetical protein